MADRPLNIPTKKLKSGFEMPVFGMGTWMMGGDFVRDPGNDDAADIEAIKTAVRMGITHIDTAERYAEGHAERLVGRAIRDFDRSRLFIVSKVGSEHLRYGDVIASAKASLQRLSTSYLDLYLVHSPNPEIPVEETMAAMDTLVQEGLIRSVGVSNFSVERLEEAQSKTRSRIVVNQLHFNLIFREPERKGLLHFCQTRDLMFVAWRPVQKGILSKKGTPLMDEMCRKYGKTPAQIAINWLISQENVVTLSKMRRIEHMRENLGALGWNMEADDIERLRREFPSQRDVSDAVPII
ncbi:MAG: aldo/keto reductase [Deltaproteobacteria bacterium]|nr:aldo/keto reductase [Deltaproteobacteria bacterium]